MLTNALAYPKSMQNAHRIRPHYYGRSDFEQLGRLLKDFRRETELPQRQRRGQAANAATDDSDSHQVFSRSVHFSSSFLLYPLPHNKIYSNVDSLPHK